MTVYRKLNFSVDVQCFTMGTDLSWIDTYTDIYDSDDKTLLDLNIAVSKTNSYLKQITATA